MEGAYTFKKNDHSIAMAYIGIYSGGVESGYTSHTNHALFVSRITPVPEYICSAGVTTLAQVSGGRVIYSDQRTSTYSYNQLPP